MRFRNDAPPRHRSLSSIKPLLVVSLLVVRLGTAPKAHSADVVDLSLTGEWDFTYVSTSVASIPALPSSSAFDCKIHVPGRWDDQLDRLKSAKWWPQAIFRTALGPIQYLSGVGWHRKEIDVPVEWANRAATLTIGHAVGTTHVWLNGEHL